MTIPNQATHEWCPMDDFHHPIIQRLRYYHPDELWGWMVYSDITGWRHSKNTPEWFKTETELGFFKKLETE